VKTILVVDDEEDLVEALTVMLADEGYRVVSARNGRDALKRLHEEKPRLVLTDFVMPIADGCELVRGMREIEEFRSTPVVMMSASTTACAVAGSSRPLELAAFLPKPFRWEQLLETVVGLIGSAS